MPAPVQSAFNPPSLPTSFNDLESHLSGIIYGSWLRASEQIKNSNEKLGDFRFLTGPNTTLDFKDRLKVISNVTKLYSNFSAPKNLTIIEYNFKDIDWAQEQYKSIKTTFYDPNLAKNQCSSEFGCNSGFAGSTQSGDGVVLVGQGSTEVSTNHEYRVLRGQVYAHEYTHVVQMVNSLNPNSGANYGMLPQWLLEGNADWSGTAATFNENYTDYLRLRNLSLDNQYKNSATFTSEWIKTFLNPNFNSSVGQNNWSYWDKYDRWYVYAFGQMVNEILVSIKGTDSVMNLYKDSGNGMSFTDAFQKEFGMPWSEAINYISEAIAAELKQGIKS